MRKICFLRFTLCLGHFLIYLSLTVKFHMPSMIFYPKIYLYHIFYKTWLSFLPYPLISVFWQGLEQILIQTFVNDSQVHFKYIYESS